MTLRRYLVPVPVGLLLVALVGCDPRNLPLVDGDQTPGPTGGVSGTGGGAGGAPGGGMAGAPAVGGGIGGGSGGTGGAAGAGGAIGFVPLPPGVTPQPYVPVTKIVGDCATPSSGTQVAPASAAEVASLLVGRWQLCGGGAPGTNPSGDGMEFARDRHWRRLDLVAGALAPGTGFDSDGVWYMSGEDPRDMVASVKNVVRIVLTGRSAGTGYPVEFVQNPTRLRFGGGAIYVWRGE